MTTWSVAIGSGDLFSARDVELHVRSVVLLLGLLSTATACQSGPQPGLTPGPFESSGSGSVLTRAFNVSAGTYIFDGTIRMPAMATSCKFSASIVSADRTRQQDVGAVSLDGADAVSSLDASPYRLDTGAYLIDIKSECDWAVRITPS